jgi:catechol 2,3-dioxygenase-like lactoylglutathione lyase family enzyme
LIDHFNLPVIDITVSRRFYVPVLRTLGLQFLVQDGNAIGFGKNTWQFGLVTTEAPIPKLHVAFSAASHAAVDAFYRAGLNAGAVSNGAPGYRPRYDPEYYAAFLLDPDGHNIEAVCRVETARDRIGQP